MQEHHWLAPTLVGWLVTDTFHSVTVSLDPHGVFSHHRMLYIFWKVRQRAIHRLEKFIPTNLQGELFWAGPVKKPPSTLTSILKNTLFKISGNNNQQTLPRLCKGQCLHSWAHQEHTLLIVVLPSTRTLLKEVIVWTRIAQMVTLSLGWSV